jgi:meiotically up-regulated gene 157 (Mug157) protein
LAAEVEKALKEHAVVTHPQFGKVYAYEVNGFGSYNLMDDANVPSLLAMPYLGAIKNTDPIYQNTRKLVLSSFNPFFFKGTAGEGIGGPHVGQDMIWPMAIIMRGLTSNSETEIKNCIDMLRKTHGDTGFMHESFHKDDPKKFTRKWFAWANTLFGEFLWKTYREKPHLLA